MITYIKLIVNKHETKPDQLGLVFKIQYHIIYFCHIKITNVNTIITVNKNYENIINGDKRNISRKPSININMFHKKVLSFV